MSNQNGISLISLAIMIIIIIILASIVTMTSISSIKETSDTKVDVEIGELKKAISDRITNYERNPEKYPLIGEKITNPEYYLYNIDNLSNSEAGRIASELSEENIDYFRLVDSDDASKLGVDSVKEDHYFLVDYYSGKVYGNINMKAANEAQEY